jgi:hypothetical protein
METNTKKLSQLDFFTDYENRIKAIEDRRTFEDILSRVGKRKFGRADLLFYNRQLTDIIEKAKITQSILKTTIQSMGTFKSVETLEAISNEASQTIQSDLIEILLIIKEVFIGRESEGDLLPKEERESRK